MSKFRHSICDPLNPKIIEKGSIDRIDIIPLFSSFPWSQYLKKMNGAKETEIYFSPSLEFENKLNSNGLAISAVDEGNPNEFELYLFYKRPKMVTKYWGLSKKLDRNYVSSLTEQTEQNAIDCLKALINDDFEYLENYFNQ